MNAAKQEKSLVRRLAPPMIGGGIAGFAAAFLFLNLTELDGARALGASREIAGLVAIVYLLAAIATGVGVASPRVGARFLNVEDADELREQRRLLTYSCIALVSLGGALFLLVFTEPVGPIGGEIGVVIAVALVLLACVLGHLQARHIDELQRALSRDSVATTFYLVFTIGGGWALLAHCGLTAPPTPLNWLTMFATFLLVGCLWQAGRRGLLTRGPN